MSQLVFDAYPESTTKTRRSRSPSAPLELMSDADLLAEVTGEKINADELRRAGGLRALLHNTAEGIDGRALLPPHRQRRFVAAVELARRTLRARDTRVVLTSPDEVYSYLVPSMAGLQREQFRVLSFNSRNVLLGDDCVSIGTATLCPVDPRDVFSAAIKRSAVGIIVAHNHPSGDPSPSTQDVSITRQLESAAAVLNIKLLDHVIVGDGRSGVASGDSPDPLRTEHALAPRVLSAAAPK